MALHLSTYHLSIIFLSIYPSIYLSINYFCLSVGNPYHLSAYISSTYCLPILSLYISIICLSSSHLYSHLFIYLPTYHLLAYISSIYLLSICLSIYLSSIYLTHLRYVY